MNDRNLPQRAYLWYLWLSGHPATCLFNSHTYSHVVNTQQLTQPTLATETHPPAATRLVLLVIVLLVGPGGDRLKAQSYCYIVSNRTHQDETRAPSKYWYGVGCFDMTSHFQDGGPPLPAGCHRLSGSPPSACDVIGSLSALYIVPNE